MWRRALGQSERATMEESGRPGAARRRRPARGSEASGDEQVMAAGAVEVARW